MLRSRGRVSKSTNTTCCHVPSSSCPFSKGIVSDGLSRAARKWLEPLSFEELVEIAYEAGFEFDRRDACSRTRNKSQYLAPCQAAFTNRALEVRRDVVDIAVSVGVELN